MRGYFAIGVEGVSKPMNVGNLMRSAHAFGASFVFTVAAHPKAGRAPSDTSKTHSQVPFYRWLSVEEMVLPTDCSLVGVELLDEAVDLPSFRHPARAAYVFGPERGTLSPAMLARCSQTIKIPTTFCINVATAGSIVMYDRIISLGNYARRPTMTGQDPEVARKHVRGGPKQRRKGSEA
ncbi:MAG: RNA methyltransferase [Alphaproteobacteria bacterium]|nr:RNA methyltransferase [Alphaproteobacteria bacterium]